MELESLYMVGYGPTNEKLAAYIYDGLETMVTTLHLDGIRG